MTREEAILLLHDMKDTYDEIHENTNCEIGYEQMTALDMAVEALSAELPKGDMISRADAIEAVNMLDIFPPTKDAVARELMALPSAEAEQVTGKLKKHCDSLLKSDSDECKEQKSKLDLIRREDAINAIDDAIDTDSPQWAILRTKIGFLPSAEAEKTYIGIDIPYGSDKGIAAIFKRKDDKLILEEVKELMRSWIPCSERLPEVGEICLLTVREYGWNCKDYTRVIIGEYSDNYADHILAWMPLPDPYTEMEP